MPSPKKLAAADEGKDEQQPSPSDDYDEEMDMWWASAAQRLAGSSWEVEGRYFWQSAVEHETFVLRRDEGGGLVGDGIADETDPFQLEHVELEQVRDVIRLRFEQVYEDGTRNGWYGELDEDLASIVNGQWKALSGVGIGAQIGTFTAQRVNSAHARPVSYDLTEETSDLEQDHPAEPGSPQRTGMLLTLQQQLELEQEQTRSQVDARLAAERRLFAQQEAEDSSRAREQASRVAVLRVEGHPGLGSDYDRLLSSLRSVEGDGAQRKLRKAWVATSLRRGSARSVGRVREAEEFLQQHADQPSDTEFWDLDPEQLWFCDDTATGEVEYNETDVAKFDRGCYNGDYVPVLAEGATVGWPHYLNGFGRFLYRTAKGRWNFSVEYGPQLAVDQDDVIGHRETGVASTREGRGEVPTGSRRWKGKLPGKQEADAERNPLVLTITEEPVAQSEEDFVEISTPPPTSTGTRRSERGSRPETAIDVELETESADKHSAYVGAEDAGDVEAQPATDVRTELIAESTRHSSGAAAHPTHQRLHELETENAALCGTVAALKEELRVQHLRDQTHTDLFSESSSSRAPSHQRLRELEAENSELKVTLATVRVKLEVQLADAVQDVARLRSESRSRQEECTSLRRELALATPPLPHDEQTSDWSMALRDEITRLKAVGMENEALCDTVAAMKEELRVQQRELLQSNTELQRKRDEVHLLQTELAKRDEDQTQATLGETERGERQRELVDEVFALRKQLEDQERDLRNELARRDESIAQMRVASAAELSQQGLEQASLAAGESARRTELAAMESKCHRAEAELDMVKRESARLDRDCSALRKRVEVQQRVEAELDVAKRELARFERDCASLMKEVDQFKERDARGKALDLALEQELDSLRADLKEAIAAQLTQEDAMQKLEEQLAECHVEIEEYREECQLLRRKQQDLAKQNEALTGAVAAAEEVAAQKGDELDRAQAMALRLNHENEAILRQGAEQELHQSDEFENVTDELRRLKSALRASEAELAVIREEAQLQAQAAAESRWKVDALVAEAPADISHRVEAATAAARQELAAEHAEQEEQTAAEMQQLQLAMGEAHRLADAAQEKLRACEVDRDALRVKLAGTAEELKQLRATVAEADEAVAILEHRLQVSEEQKESEQQAHAAQEQAWMAERKQLQIQSSAALHTAYGISRTGSGASGHSASSLGSGTRQVLTSGPVAAAHTTSWQQVPLSQHAPPGPTGPPMVLPAGGQQHRQQQQHHLRPASELREPELLQYKDENDRLRAELAQRLERLAAKTDEVERARHQAARPQHDRYHQQQYQEQEQFQQQVQQQVQQHHYQAQHYDHQHQQHQHQQHQHQQHQHQQHQQQQHQQQQQQQQQQQHAAFRETAFAQQLPSQPLAPQQRPLAQPPESLPHRDLGSPPSGRSPVPSKRGFFTKNPGGDSGGQAPV